MGEDVTVRLTGQGMHGETGTVGANVTVRLTGESMHAEIGVLSWINAREYWEKRPLPLLGVIVLSIGAPFLGLFLAGWVGVVVGLAISSLVFPGGVFAITRVREITRPR